MWYRPYNFIPSIIIIFMVLCSAWWWLYMPKHVDGLRPDNVVFRLRLNISVFLTCVWGVKYIYPPTHTQPHPHTQPHTHTHTPTPTPTHPHPHTHTCTPTLHSLNQKTYYIITKTSITCCILQYCNQFCGACETQTLPSSNALKLVQFIL
jgi:hypothetical protein